MKTNRQTLDYLFETQQIDLRRGAIFDTSPEPLPGDFDFGRVEGMMLGLAIGDSLGNTTEGKLPRDRRARYGEIRDYLPNHHANGQPIGLPSDDTQLAFWTLEQMMADGGLNPEHLAARFCRDRIFGIGHTIEDFTRNYKSERMLWYKCGVKSAGNGALMRIAPMVIPHLKTGTADLWVDTALSAMVTHNDSGSTAACLSFVNMIWQLFSMTTPPQPNWWLETCVEIAKGLERDTYCPRGGDFVDYRGPIWRFVEEKVGEVYGKGLSVVDACKSWHSGAFLLETVPSVIFILMRHGDNLEEAIIRAVNDTRDNDTIAAIVGAAVGALHGKGKIPERWLSNLSGRTIASDGGRIFELLTEARRIWWDHGTD
jgi:ADP-ribosyl-[dinitrogen reductase] hydrolase